MEGADNDVMIVDSTTNSYKDLMMTSLNEHSDKPLMMLFKRLIGNDNKENTVLTNAQIIDILQKEFNMDIIYSHKLEIEIYLNILKKFLKDWPQWDEFDFAVNALKNQRDISDKIKTLLESKYQSLKTYLHHTLKSVEPLLRKTMKEVKEKEEKTENSDDDNIIMQLQCTRQKLNQLFFRRPHPDFNNSIFNIEDKSPSKIRISALTVEQMLNWPGIQINFNLNGTLVFRRDMYLNLKHVLVNKKLNYKNKTQKILKTNLQIGSFKLSPVDTDIFLEALDDIYKAQYSSDDIRVVVQAVCNLIKSDLKDGPRQLQFPAVYRKILTKSPLVRYLYTNVDTPIAFEVNNYDLQLEETAIPQFYLNLSKFQRKNDILASGTFLKIDCTLCACKFRDGSILELMKQHIEEFHQWEPDWRCTMCKKTFTMESLLKLKYTHTCEPADSDCD